MLTEEAVMDMGMELNMNMNTGRITRLERRRGMFVMTS
jgi:hypothetical protein